MTDRFLTCKYTHWWSEGSQDKNTIKIVYFLQRRFVWRYSEKTVNIFREMWDAVLIYIHYDYLTFTNTLYSLTVSFKMGVKLHYKRLDQLELIQNKIIIISKD